jgi:hypothetical protein
MAKTRTRNRKGQFVKGHSTSSTALARRPSQAVKKYKRGSTRTVVKYRTRGGGGGGRGPGVVNELKALGPELLASSLYGYATQAPATDDKGEETMAAKARELLDKIPVIDTIGKPATHGVAFLFGGSLIGGKARRYFGLAAKAALHKAAGNLGASAFDLEAAAKLGDDESGGTVHLEGDVSDADIVG